MARMISRQAAAELLDCNPQTISNWVEKGVIKGHMVGNFLMIDRQSIEQYFDSLKDLSDMESKMADVKKELQDAIMDMKTVIDEARGASMPVGRIRDGFRYNLLMLMSLYEDCLKDREREIFTRLVNGESLEDVAHAFGISSKRVIQIGCRVSVIISEKADLKQLYEEIKELKRENEHLKLQSSNLRKRLNDYEKEDVVKEERLNSSIFQKRIIDLNLTVRSLNVLKSNNCETLGDVVKLTKEEICKSRNMGKKSFIEINDFLTKLGLHWGMNPDMMSAEELQSWQESDSI
jgi:hypothetical protein